MSGQHGLYGLTELAFGYDGFDPFFCRFFDLPDFTDKGMRPFMGFETAFAFSRKGTVAVVADIAGTGVGQGLADGVTMAFRDVDGNFIEFVFGDGNEALQIRQAQEAGQDVVDAAVGTIQVGMGAVDGNVVGQEFLVHAAAVCVGPQGFQTIENDRVMADDHLDAVFDGIIDGPHHDVQGDHEFIDRFVRAADEQARIIPRFFERQRRPSFQYFDDFTYCSCHFNSLQKRNSLSIFSIRSCTSLRLFFRPSRMCPFVSMRMSILRPSSGSRRCQFTGPMS